MEIYRFNKDKLFMIIMIQIKPFQMKYNFKQLFKI